MGWRKFFIDQTLISEPASWSTTRLDGIQKVELEHYDWKLALEGPGEYWQSDTFVVRPTDITPKLIQRRIERLVNLKQEIPFSIQVEKNICISFNNPSSFMLGSHLWSPAKYQNIDSKQWFVLELDIQQNIWRWYLSQGKV